MKFLSIRSGRPARSAAGTVVVGLGAGCDTPSRPSRLHEPAHRPLGLVATPLRSKTLRTRLQQVGSFGARVRKTRHKNWRVPLRRFAGFRHAPVPPGCSSPECDTTRTEAHHTGSGMVAFLGGGVYAYRALDRDSRHGEKTTVLSLKSIPRPGLTQLGLDFLALSKSGPPSFPHPRCRNGLSSTCTPSILTVRGTRTVGLRHLGWPCRGFSTPTRHDMLFELFTVLRCRHGTDLCLTCSIKPVFRHCPRNV